MANYYFSQTWVGLENGTVVNVIGGGTATIGTDAFAYGYDAYAAGLASGGAYGEDWFVKTCDVYVDDAYASYAASDPIDLVLVNPNDPSQSYTATGALTKGVDAVGSASHANATDCKTILNSAKTLVNSHGVGAIVVTNIGGTAGTPYAFGSLSSGGGFFAQGKPIVIDGAELTGSSTGAPISAGNNASVSKTSATVNSGYVAKLWGGGLNGTFDETNVTINGGTVGTIAAGGYSGTVGVGNVLVTGSGNVGNIYGSNGNKIADFNVTLKNVTSFTGNIIVNGANNAASLALTNNFTLTVINSTMTRGLTGNQGNTASGGIFNNFYAHFINSTAGTISYANGYVSNGTGAKASVNSFVIHVEGSNLTEAGGNNITMRDLGDETYNKRTVRASGDVSVIGTVRAIDLFEIVAGSYLSVGSLYDETTRKAALQVDATNYHMSRGTTSEAVFSANTRSTGGYTALENGTTSSRFTISYTGNTIYLNEQKAYFSVAWASLDPGDVVSVSGGTAVVGTTAFGSYSEAVAGAAGYTIESADIYCSTEFVPDASGNVTIDGYTTPLNSYDAFDTLAGALTGYAGRLSDDAVLQILGGSYTINAATESITVTGGFSNAGTISINTDDIVIDPSTHTKVVISAAGGITNTGSITLTGTHASDYNLSIDGTTISVEEKVAYFSAVWTGLEDGTVVAISGGTAVIGTDAFATYNEAVAAGFGSPIAIDCYVNNDWSTGSQEIVVPGGTFTTTVSDTATSGVYAYNDYSAGNTARTSYSGRYGILNVVGGTYSEQLNGSLFRDADGVYNAGINLYNLISSSGMYGYTGSTAVKDVVLNLYGSTISGGTVCASNASIGTNPGVITGVVNINLVDSNVVSVFGLGINNNGSASASELSLSIDINLTDSIADYVYFSGRGTGGTTVVNTTGYSRITLTGSTIAGIKESAWGEKAQFNYQGGRFITVDNSRITGSTTINNAGANSIVLLNGSTIGTIYLTTTYGAYGALTVTAGGTGASRINSALSLRSGDSLSVAAANATLTFSGALTNAGSISIDVTDLDLGGAAQKLVITASSFTNTGSISITGTGAENYYINTVGGSIYVVAHKAYFSVAWSALDPGDVVNVDGGTAIIGTNAFDNYTDAVTAHPGYIIKSADIYCNSDFTPDVSGNVTVEGYTTALNGTDAFDTLSGAISAYPSRLSTDGVLRIVGGSYTINAASETISVTGAIANAGVISINTDDLDLGAGTSHTKFVLGASAGITNTGTITLTGTDVAKYYLTTEGGSIYVNAHMTYFSAGWADLSEGDVVNVDGGTAIIGTNAFGSYAEAYEVVPNSFIYTGDIYCNSDWTDGDTVSVYGYTTTVNGSDAKNTFVAARNAYSGRLATDGVLYFVGGTYSDESGTGGSQTQLLNGIKTIMQNVNATTIIAGASGGTVTNSTNIRVKGSSIGILSGGNRANTSVNNSVTVAVEDSTISELRAAGAGLGSSDTASTLRLTISGSSVGTLHTGSQIYGSESTTTFTITDSTIRYASSAASVNAGNNYGNITWNLTNVTFQKFNTNIGIDISGNNKTCVVYGDVLLNICSGTTTINGNGLIGNASSKSTTINIAADALLTVSNNVTLASYVNITIDVDDFSFDPGVHKKLVMTGKSTASNTITITGEQASKYSYVREGVNTYLIELPDSYFSIGWSDLAEGTVVNVEGGTATIGTNAFATYDEAFGSYRKPEDVYYDQAWESASSGDIVTVNTPGGTFTAKIGVEAFTSIETALTKVGDDNYLHVVGGTVETTAATQRIGMNGKNVLFTNYVRTGDGALCGVKNAQTTVEDGRANVVIGEGSYISNYYVSRGTFSGNAVVTVRDGGYVGTLCGGCTSVTFIGGTTTINVIDGGTAGTIYASGSGDNTHDTYINVTDSRVNNTIYGGDTAMSGSLTGSLFINVSGSTIGGNVTTNYTGTRDTTGGTTSIYINDSVVSDVNLSSGTIAHNGRVDVNITDTTLNQFIGLSGDADDVDIHLDGITISRYSVTNLTGNAGALGAVDVSLTDSYVGNYYYGFSGGTATSFDMTVSGSTVNAGLHGVTGGTVSGDVNITVSNVEANSFYVTGVSATIDGDITATISGLTVGEMRFNGGTASPISGSQSLIFAGGSSTIARLHLTYSSGVDLTIAAGAVLSLGNTSAQTLFKSFTLNGELILTDASYATAVSANGFTRIASNASGTGTITIGDLSTGACVSSEGNLYAYLTEQAVVYVNADWTEQVANHTVFSYQGNSLLGGVSAFTSVESAKAFAGEDSEIIVVGTISSAVYGGGVEVELTGATTTKNVYGGSLLDSATTVSYDAHVEVDGGSYKGLIGGDRIAANVTVDGWSSVKVNSGSAQSVFGGAYVAAGGTATITADTDAVIWGGSFSSFVCGGNVVATGGSVTLSGDSILTITGGVFNGAVAGGSDSQGGYISSTSDHTCSLAISGGTFNRIFGGNVASRAEYANYTDTGAGILEETRIDINGSTSILIDTSSNAVSISGDVVAGSYGSGQVSGDTNVTFTGLGSNLSFTGYLVGDSQNAGSHSSCVGGTRSLTFDDFTGNFSGDVRGIDTVTLSTGSNVVFDQHEWYLRYANEWNFADGTSLQWRVGSNDFSGDTMNLTFDDFDSEWTIFDGTNATTTNFDDMDVTFNGGDILAYDETLGGYSDGTYLLSLNSSSDLPSDSASIKLAKLA